MLVQTPGSGGEFRRLREPLGLLLHRLYRTRGKHPRDQNVAEVVPVETPRGHQEPRQGPLGGLRGKSYANEE